MVVEAEPDTDVSARAGAVAPAAIRAVVSRRCFIGMLSSRSMNAVVPLDVLPTIRRPREFHEFLQHFCK
jgi:hypothetical protein